MEIAFKDSSKWLLNNKQDINKFILYDSFGNKFNIPKIEILYLTEKSNIDHDINFQKNIKDYSILENNIKPDIVNKYIEYYNLRKQDVIKIV